nr:unnamed protein product [Amyelois transitella]
MVLGVSWRYYYTWVLDMGDRCLDVKFVRATSSDKDRIGMNMIEYMQDTLPWEEATLMLSITPAVILQDSKPREVLLIPVEGKQGRFRGVPNMAQNVDFQLPKYSMPASNRLLKLYREGKFLLMADCDTGVAALLARVDQSVYWSEILSTAEEVWQKEGFPALILGNCGKLTPKATVRARNEQVCRKLTKTKSFREDFVLGLPWMTYYTWEVKLKSVCIEIQFTRPSNSTINYYTKIMGEYDNRIPYNQATLFGVVENYNHEMLMIPNGQPGRFMAVLDVMKGVDDSIERENILKDGVSVLQFGFKLLRKGLFLLRWDCIGGVGHLMARPGTVNDTDVFSMVKALQFRRGHISCGFQFTQHIRDKIERNCARLLKEPNFKEEMVVGKVWREYYSWNVVAKHCVETEFLAATSQMKKRFEKGMKEFVVEQPAWDTASMVARSGEYEMLMFHGEPPGLYFGIPNYAKFGSLYDFALKDVQFMKFAMKLLNTDKFLVLLDCTGGLGHIMVKANDTVEEKEVLHTKERFAIGSRHTLTEEPNWYDAELLVIIGSIELLMFPGEVRGRYKAVINARRFDFTFNAPTDMMKYAMKGFIFYKYLVLLACDLFSGYLMARPDDETVSVKEIISLVDEILPVEHGRFACLIEKSKCLIPLLKKNESMCEKMTRKSYFDSELVVGEPWRIVFTWNMSLDDKCVDMTFVNATTKIINEVWNDMYEYLEEQPVWPGATMLMTMGPTRYELLMFAQPGSAGTFTAVPNVVKKASIFPPRHSVPLLTFYLTLMERGKFLVMIDCKIGVGSLSVRRSSGPSKEEIYTVITKLELGEGSPACTGLKKEFLQDLLD